MKTNQTVPLEVSLVEETSSTNLKDIFDILKKSEVLYNPMDMEIGFIDNIQILDRKTREGQPFTQLQLNVKTADGKKFSKRYSTDFARKFFKQVGVSAADTIGKTVIFKPTGEYKNIGWFAFVVAFWQGKEGEQSIAAYDVQAYRNEETEDMRAKLEKLGL